MCRSVGAVLDERVSCPGGHRSPTPGIPPLLRSLIPALIRAVMVGMKRGVASVLCQATSANSVLATPHTPRRLPVIEPLQHGGGGRDSGRDIGLDPELDV